MLAYVNVHPREENGLKELGLDYGYPRGFDVEHLPRWLGRGGLSVFLGTAPRDETTTTLYRGPSYQLPLCIRELGLVHQQVKNWQTHIGGCVYSLAERLADWGMLEEKADLFAERSGGAMADWEMLEEKADLFAERSGGAMADQFALSGGEINGDMHVLDLETLDGRGDPVLRTWAKEWDMGDGMSFWDWFEKRAGAVFFGAEDYPLPDTQRPALAASEPSSAFPPGAKVAIVGGPLVGNAGTVVLDGGKTVKVAVAIFGRETEVDLEADDLELEE